MRGVAGRGGAAPQGRPEWTDDAVTADFRLYQRKGGHRYALDDVLAAAEAVRAVPNARSVLDLGTGIGSVLLMVAWKLREARLVGVERQALSFELLQCNVARNALGDRVQIVQGDLRDPALLDALPHRPFDLVTGTPPYFPPGTAVPSPDPQRAAARIELHGGVEDYVRSAARVLAPTGRLVLCVPARSASRVLAAAREARLQPLRRYDAYPHAQMAAPLLSVWTLGPFASCAGVELQRPEPFVARDGSGARTEAYRGLRAIFGLW